MEQLKVLVVEDDVSWQGIYKHNIEKSGCDVAIVGSKTEAFEVLERVSFDLALLDVRLDKADDQNIDGLLVLERISKLKEGTKSIVVTGHGTVKITRDALLNYGAADIREKEEINPRFIRDLVEQQRIHQQQKPKLSGWEYGTLLLGKASKEEVFAWESNMQNILKTSGSIDQMYELFQKFVEKLSPILLAKHQNGLQPDKNLDIARGYVWSKRLAQAVGIFMGNEKEMDKIFKDKDDFRNLTFDSYPCSKAVLKVDVGNISAIALSIPEMPFSNFKP